MGGGVRRVTFALPLGIDHVHCYLLPRADGSWTVVDTGLGVPDAAERWSSVLDSLDGPVARIVITHFHPDHVGAAADLAELTGAPVHQGKEDYAQCVRAWGELRKPDRMLDDLRANGVPESDVTVFRGQSAALGGLVRYVDDPALLTEGDSVDDWEVLLLPGHADGHIALLKDGVLIAGDALLATITPNVGLYPDSRPDPLADYLGSLGRIVGLAPQVAYGGHGAAIPDPVGRSQELIAHHHDRLEQATAALGGEGRTAYELSFSLWPEQLSGALRRFALAETRAHLEYLVHREQALRVDGDGCVRYAASG